MKVEIVSKPKQPKTSVEEGDVFIHKDGSRYLITGRGYLAITAAGGSGEVSLTIENKEKVFLSSNYRYEGRGHLQLHIEAA